MCLPSTTFSGISWENGILNGLIVMELLKRGISRRVDFQWILEGTAIQDVFICPSRKERLTNYQPDAAYGTTVRMYNPDTLAWDILYTELGGATQLEARWEKDRIVQTVVNNDNLRWVFSEITQTSFHWQRLVRTDGEHWTVEAELFAVRR